MQRTVSSWILVLSAFSLFADLSEEASPSVQSGEFRFESEPIAETAEPVAEQQMEIAPLPAADAMELPAASSCTRQTPKEEPKPAPVIAQPTPMAPQISCDTLMPAYNGTAQVNVDGCWDFFANGSFLYYQANQDNMYVAITNPDPLITMGTPKLFSDGSEIVDQKLNWEPGFKVGLGMNFNYDDWAGFAEYTWFHHSYHSTANAPNQPTGRLSIYGTSELGANNALSIGSLWKLGMDILDGALVRSYYVGSRLTFTTYSGMRGLWIDQKNKLTFTQTTTGDEVEALYKTTSWGVGPRMGVDMGWLLGSGFRLIGNIAGDVCYSSYKIRFSEYQNPGTDSALTYFTLKYNENAIRTHLQSGIGFGWGSYFAENNWHVDFAATYDFQVFWDQNMIRLPITIYQNGVDFSGNLYLQGLSLKMILDF